MKYRTDQDMRDAGFRTPTTGECLNFDLMIEVMNRFAAMRRTAWPVGIACCPEVKALIEKYEPEKTSDNFLNLVWGIPFIIDIRMTRGVSEVYYDLEAWHERCREQTQYDSGGGYRFSRTVLRLAR